MSATRPPTDPGVAGSVRIRRSGQADRVAVIVEAEETSIRVYWLDDGQTDRVPSEDIVVVWSST